MNPHATTEQGNLIVEPLRQAPDRDFPLAVIGQGTVVHFVDDYRSKPGRTLCGHAVERLREDRELKPGERMCNRCARSKWPTLAECEQYARCTDCGVDCHALREVAYQVRTPVWGQAYPGYNEQGIGIGTSRPCIGCLEWRLQRLLNRTDFTNGDINSPNPDLHSLRLMSRLRRIPLETDARFNTGNVPGTHRRAAK